MLRSLQVVTLVIVGFIALSLQAQEKKTREQKVTEDRQRVEAEGFWIYNDLQRGYDEARKSGKPILVVLRCIPCEECVKLDDDLVDQDPLIRPLLEQFVCVRVVSTNGLDLATFQYDTDQSFAAFMLNVDGTIYGRFGTRSHRNEWAGDVSLPGLAKALQGAISLHAAYPRDREALAGKRGGKPRFASPELYPLLKDKYTAKLNETGNVVQSCIHCHQIGDAERDYYRRRGEPIPDELLFPYPHPKSIGLVLDAEQRATVSDVATDSLAEAAGLTGGDELIRMNGQPLLSMADVQWVLNSVDNHGGVVSVDLRRAGQMMKLTLKLPDDWRSAGDIDWRASTWGLRRMATGGLVMEAATAEERNRAGIAEHEMALRVKHVGQYGPHAAAKNAGFRKDDLLISLDGQTNLLRESDVLRLGVQQKRPGDQVAAVVYRDGKRISLNLPIQD